MLQHFDSDLKSYLRSTIDLADVQADISTDVVDLYDPETSDSYPRVTISDPSGTALSAGGGAETGWTGVAGDGSGPVSTRRDSVQVSCYAGHEDTSNLNAHPYAVSRELVHAVERAVHASPGGPPDYQTMGPGPTGPVDDFSVEPPIYGRYIIIAATYFDHPDEH